MVSGGLCMFPSEAVKLKMGKFFPVPQKLTQEIKTELQKLYNLTSRMLNYQDIMTLRCTDLKRLKNIHIFFIIFTINEFLKLILRSQCILIKSLVCYVLNMKCLIVRNVVQWLPTKNCTKIKEKPKSHHLVLATDTLGLMSKCLSSSQGVESALCFFTSHPKAAQGLGSQAFTFTPHTGPHLFSFPSPVLTPQYAPQINEVENKHKAIFYKHKSQLKRHL